MTMNFIIRHEKWFKTETGELVVTRKSQRHYPPTGTVVTDSYGKEYLVHANGQITRK